MVKGNKLLHFHGSEAIHRVCGSRPNGREQEKQGNLARLRLEKGYIHHGEMPLIDVQRRNCRVEYEKIMEKKKVESEYQ